MELTGIPTPKIDWNSSNLIEQWKQFHEHISLIFSGPLTDKNEAEKCTYLLLWVGHKGREVFKSWDLSADDAKKLSKLYEKFNRYVEPKVNSVFKRYQFNNIVQEQLSIEDYVTKLKIHVKDCNYPNKEEMIRDRLVFGLNSKKIREKLLSEGDKLTLEKSIQIAQSYEYAQKQLRTINHGSNPPHEVGANRGKHREVKQSKPSIPKKTPNRKSLQEARQHPPTSTPSKKCPNCGYSHNKSSPCPAKGKQCNNCLKWNLFHKMCRQNKKGICELEENLSDTSDDLDFYVDAIRSDQVFCNILVGPQRVSIPFKLDTGASCNILPESHFKSLKVKAPLQKAKCKLTAYNGENLNVLGKITLQCRRHSQTDNMVFYVVDDNTSRCPILGLRSCIDFNLIQVVMSVDSKPLSKESVLSEFPTLFTGIGRLDGEVSIKVNPEITPVVHTPRRVPVSLQDKVKNELTRMEKSGIIEKVKKPTRLVNSMVVVSKPGKDKVRICLDPKDLNKAISRPHYPMRTLDDILPMLSDAKVWTKMDCKNGYWSMVLDEESAVLTTFNTPIGRFMYKRLPFGLVSSQDEFQRKMDECLDGLEGCAVICDDICVFGRTVQEHDQNLRNVLERCQQQGIRLNRDKLEVGMSELSYFGHILSSDGLKPDPKKVSAIRDMKPPKDRAELQRILGMVVYLARFVPNLSEITSPLRQLLNKEVLFHWEEPQKEAFQKVKDLLTQCPGPVLAFYDPDKPLIMQCDSSKYGLGVGLLQENRAIAYASKSLTPTEVNYAQIEKELFAIVFGCKRFHQYIYGRRVLVQTDHLPLLAVMKKPMHSAPARLQRMLLQLQGYDIVLEHKPGTEIPLADTLSRHFLQDTYPELSEATNHHVNFVMKEIPVSDRKMQEIRSHTKQDPELQMLKDVIQNGWPEKRQQCPEQLSHYWNYRDELSVIDDIIVKGQRLFIPKALRSNM